MFKLIYGQDSMIYVLFLYILKPELHGKRLLYQSHKDVIRCNDERKSEPVSLGNLRGNNRVEKKAPTHSIPSRWLFHSFPITF